jgi:hypothetical protein
LWLKEELQRLGYSVYVTQFVGAGGYLTFFFLALNFCSSYGWNVGTTVKAPRADGTESVLVATEYNRDLSHLEPPKQYLDSLGVAVSIAKELSSTISTIPASPSIYSSSSPHSSSLQFLIVALTLGSGEVDVT